MQAVPGTDGDAVGGDLNMYRIVLRERERRLLLAASLFSLCA